MSKNVSDHTKGTKDLKLPLLLAGPILRRAEPKQVCIWIACSRAVQIRAEILRILDLNENNPNKGELKNTKTAIIGLGTAKSIQLGERLHVALVIARPMQPDNDIEDIRNNSNENTSGNHSNTATTSENGDFPTDKLLAYDIEVTYNNGSSNIDQRLKDFGLLSGPNTIIYKKNQDDNSNKNSEKEILLLPTFFLQGKRSPLNLLYGSCRKLHGKGEDCLALADEIIASSVEDLNKRPSALFLTGDQIYADDVASTLIQYLTQFGINLLGWEEKIHGIGNKRLIEIGVGERQELVQKYAKFTSDSAGNHLLSFGEFAAMYLLAWNVENWPPTYPDFKTLSSTYNNKEQDEKKYRTEVEQLDEARKALTAVRRVFANVPTYMICDDHEITDDWNITKEWHEGVKSSGCGRQIVANGLAAYWAFQAWGNDPDLYSKDFIQNITKYLKKKDDNVDDVVVNETKSFEDYIWNFHRWTFVAPTIPCSIFLDCRTQRHYDSLAGPPQLLNEEELHSIEQALLHASYKNGDTLIMVPPTPVFGFDLAEELQKYLASKSSVYKWDLETWSANERGFVRFLTFIIQNLGPRHCIFLSGDVHYGFTISASFTLLQKKYGKEDLLLPITQLNSSALKTTSIAKEMIITKVLGSARQFFSSRHSARVGWNDMSSDSKKLKERNPNLYTSIINYFRHNPNIYEEHALQPTTKTTALPDWIESRSIVKASGHGIFSLIIADNNLGLLTIHVDKNKILRHRLLVRKEKKVKVYDAITEIG
jgi:hypothetical protein